ncbi:MAG: SGNH/GDSL hydrolase family protein [Rhodobacterales bacterium]|nr:SGNH/GDSL hydrolase family protein [Rhodobacterales bacterium]MDX5389853.1 SGNH/GDSL hydrolase family protein [Rhodobacterales bacterium]MDX5489544.1 SGNH/GDSL hydrolase family protein [Rhodobacterales bacterium]
MRLSILLLAGCLAATSTQYSARAEAPGAPDVLILGDSQLTFGAGKAFVALLSDMAGSCGLAKDTSTGVIGVRSSAITSWTGRTKRAKSAICDVDPTWKVNAGAYGTLSQGENPYVQIGKGAQFQFCRPDRSPLNAVLADGYYNPRLLIFFMMGNAADRWAESEKAASQDVEALMADLPPDQPCIFMTSAPPYGEKVVRLRQRAQDNIEKAFAASGSHCSFVPGLTPATIRENMGNPTNFRRKSSGQVKDPYHPTEPAARRFLALQRKALCQAIARQLPPG